MSAVIRVVLSRNELQIEPGQRGELSLTIQNLSEIVDQYNLEVEGLDAAWLTLSPPRISLFPQDEGQVTIKLHPPETARAGTYDFAVKVVSRENPVEWSRAQATLDVTPVFLFDVSLSPQRKSIVEAEATFDLELTNPGNVDLTLDFSATDPEAGCAYRFDPSQATVEAGGKEQVQLTVTPGQAAQEEGRLYTFTVTAAPVDAPGRARTVSGQLHCQPQVVSLDVGLWPERRSAVGAGTFQLQLDNRGNTDLNLLLEGTDPAEACAYKFDAQRVTLPAGQSRQVRLTVAPIGRPPTDQPRVYNFTVRAVPEKAPHKAVQATGELECLPVTVAFDLAIVPDARTAKREGEYQVRLVNRSEVGLSLELEAVDQAGACDCSLGSKRVSLGPEETRMVPLTVAAREKPARGETSSHAFSVTATPADAAHLAKKATGRLKLVRPRGLGPLIWSALGFAVGNGILLPLLWWGVIPEFEGTAYVIFAVMGAVGGLLLGIGVRRRVLLASVAGALGFLPGGYLAMSGSFEDVALQAIWGAFAGGLLGLALGHGWRAIAVAAAGALALPLRMILADAMWETPLGNVTYEVAAVTIDVIIGAVTGLVVGVPILFLERWRDWRQSQQPEH